MKNNKYFLNTLLVGVLFAVMAVFMVLRAVQPPVILPPLNIPNMVLVSLVVLLLEHYLAPGNDRCYICIPVLAALTFGLLPLMAGFACQHTFCRDHLPVYLHDGSAAFRSQGICSTFCKRGRPLSGCPVLCRYHPVMTRKIPAFMAGIFCLGYCIPCS